MSKQEQIAALRKEIKKNEEQLYRAEKEANAWNKGKYKSYSMPKRPSCSLIHHVVG